MSRLDILFIASMMGCVGLAGALTFALASLPAVLKSGTWILSGAKLCADLATRSSNFRSAVVKLAGGDRLQ
jgi:hypothetical protein